MFNYLKQGRKFFYFINFVSGNNQRLINTTKCFVSSFNYAPQIRLSVSIQKQRFLLSNDQFRVILIRNKSGKKKSRFKKQEIDSDESSDEEDDFEDLDDTSHWKKSDIRILHLNNLRFDLILKMALGISRKKIEEAFYQNKIRINGNKVLKKSLNVNVDDEIDLIKGCESSVNKLQIGRVKILGIKVNPEEGNILVKVLRMKSLLIDYYEEEEFKESTQKD